MTVRIHRSKQENMQRAKHHYRLVMLLFLIFILSAAACTPPSPGGAVNSPARAPAELTATPTPEGQTSVTFTAEADTYARQSRPSINYGYAPTLRVAAGGDRDHEVFIRFSVTGISGEIERAVLRMYVTNGTDDGPAVYDADSSWNETELTWRQRPVRSDPSVDDLDRLRQETWAEFDVTPLVTGNETVSFVLVADSSDAAMFSSRQGRQPPQLVVIYRRDTSSSIIPVFTPTPSVEDDVRPGLAIFDPAKTRMMN
jgi:hypothetical protein